MIAHEMHRLLNVLNFCSVLITELKFSRNQVFLVICYTNASFCKNHKYGKSLNDRSRFHLSVRIYKCYIVIKAVFVGVGYDDRYTITFGKVNFKKSVIFVLLITSF